MIEKTFIENLKKRREALGLTQKDTAEAAELSVRYYQKVESGVSWPPPDTLRMLGKALKIEAIDLFQPKENQNKLLKSDLILILQGLLVHLTEVELRALIRMANNFPSVPASNKSAV